MIQGSENIKAMNRKVLSYCLLGSNHLRDDEGAGVRYQKSKILDQGSMTEKMQAGSRTREPISVRIILRQGSGESSSNGQGL